MIGGEDRHEICAILRVFFGIIGIDGYRANALRGSFRSEYSQSICKVDHERAVIAGENDQRPLRTRRIGSRDKFSGSVWQQEFWDGFIQVQTE